MLSFNVSVCVAMSFYGSINNIYIQGVWKITL